MYDKIAMAENFAEHVLGTCYGPDQSWEGYREYYTGQGEIWENCDLPLEFGDFDSDMQAAFFEITEECEKCGWYVEPYELDENMYCSDCHEGEDE